MNAGRLRSNLHMRFKPDGQAVFYSCVFVMLAYIAVTVLIYRPTERSWFSVSLVAVCGAVFIWEGHTAA